ncbi:MAG: hypothetical protein CL506_00315 [Actinobacteria bacterium]|mgnify:FL=1|jgi:hypothetical protein|nr:hypothetical protein [Actinomycetota bacterium]|tara:strand:- start:2758 stop:3309 length:552 start_codon:yes stop_codon:yes gene_type:complete
MLYDHIVFPGAVEEIVDEMSMSMGDLQSKGNASSGAGKNVEVDWYGGGYVSNIEENVYYYFKRANSLNFGYDISYTEAVRWEKYSKGGSYSVRKELNHFYQNHLDRKLVAVVNMNDPFDPKERGGNIVLYESTRKRTSLDDIFYQKKGAIAVFNVFTGYEIEEVKCEEGLSYLFCFCVGDKWR